MVGIIVDYWIPSKYVGDIYLTDIIYNNGMVDNLSWFGPYSEKGPGRYYIEDFDE